MLSRVKIGSRKIVLAAVITVDDEHGGTRDVPLLDPAVDAEKSDLKAYKESHFDTSYLKFYEGEEPTYFTIRQMTRKQKDAVETFPENVPRKRAAFYIMCAVERVDNFQITDEDGGIIDLPQPKRKPNGNLGIMAQESWVDKMNLLEGHLHGLAYHIKVFSEASDPLSRPSEPQSGDTSPPGATEEQ